MVSRHQDSISIEQGSSVWTRAKDAARGYQQEVELD